MIFVAPANDRGSLPVRRARPMSFPQFPRPGRFVRGVGVGGGGLGYRTEPFPFPRVSTFDFRRLYSLRRSLVLFRPRLRAVKGLLRAKADAVASTRSRARTPMEAVGILVLAVAAAGGLAYLIRRRIGACQDGNVVRRISDDQFADVEGCGSL